MQILASFIAREEQQIYYPFSHFCKLIFPQTTVFIIILFIHSFIHSFIHWIAALLLSLQYFSPGSISSDICLPERGRLRWRCCRRSSVTGSLSHCRSLNSNCRPTWARRLIERYMTMCVQSLAASYHQRIKTASFLCYPFAYWNYFALKNICKNARKLQWKTFCDWKIFEKICYYFNHYISIELFCDPTFYGAFAKKFPRKLIPVYGTLLHQHDWPCCLQT